MSLKDLKSKKSLYLWYAKEARSAGVPDVEQNWLADAEDVQKEIDKIQKEEREKEDREEHDAWREKYRADLQSGRYRRY